MIGEIIAIGDELTSGRIGNTTSSFAASQLFAAGHEICAMHTIGDSQELIGEALRRALGRAEFVIVTGGLGATSDDRTNQAVAETLNRPPTLHREILAHFADSRAHGDEERAALEKLAWLPEGAEVLDVGSRMAGYLLVHENRPIFFLPGVPEQMKELFIDHVLPCLAGWSPDNRDHVRRTVYRTFGLSENTINRLLQSLEDSPHLKIGYYPVDGEVHVSLTVAGKDKKLSDRQFSEADGLVRELLGDAVYGIDQESMALVVGRLLLQNSLRLGLAESCTGGLIAAKITEVPGSSEWFAGGVVAYSNELKTRLLAVDSGIIAEHGAVSSQVVRAMARGIAETIGTRAGIAVTGIAGPSGGTADKPVGTVYIGLFMDGSVTDRLFHFSGSRKQVQQITALTALDLARRALLQQKGDENGRIS